MRKLKTERKGNTCKPLSRRDSGVSVEPVAPKRSGAAKPTISIDETLQEACLLHQQGKLSEAEAIYRDILQSDPHHFNALHLLGVVRYQHGNYQEAVGLIKSALGQNSKSAEAHYNLGLALWELKRLEAALVSCQRSLEIQPDFAEAQFKIGNIFEALSRHEEAIESYQRAIEIRPKYTDAYHNLGNALKTVQRYEEALASYRQVLKIQPNYPYAFSSLAFTERCICNWANFWNTESKLRKHIRQAGSIVSPFVFLSFSSEPSEQLQCAQLWVKYRVGSNFQPLYSPKIPAAGPIRVAYLSADFRQHATGYLMAELFEQHDRNHFEVFGFSWGRDDGSTMRHRLERAFDHFIDVSNMSDDQVACQIADLNIHITIDLKGHTKDLRLGIFARRPAPVQVNYLGFPGTMGAEFIDYILVDPFVVPADQQPFFTEKLVHLPDCYQVNDRQRQIANHTPTRAACGLPEDGFVFCCFNKNYKITPRVFGIWMRLLNAVPGSVLWLFRDNEIAVKNLRQEAKAGGIEPQRLVFAERRKLPEHLARHRVADLFLDTLPCNAHTTASDALWAGLPVVTCAGRTFAGRVAGSLLHAVGLPELVTKSLEEYEALALKLATDPKALKSIHEKLARNRATAPLFDTDRFRRHIEAAYTEMWRIWGSGERPRPFAVEPPTGSFGADRGTSPERQSALSRDAAPQPTIAIQHTQQAGQALAKAVAFRVQDKLSETETLCEEILQADSQHFDALYLLGVVRGQQGKHEAAVAALKRALIQNPNVAQVHTNLGRALRNLNRPEEAIVHFRRSVEIQPELADAHYYLGNALSDLNQYAEAMASYRRALALRPDYAEAHCGLGITLRAEGKLEEAKGQYQRALALRPNYAEAYNNLGFAFKEEGKLDDAEVYYRCALAINPDFAMAHWNYALSLLLQGDFVHGWQEYEWRWKVAKFPSLAWKASGPLWDGTPLKGRTILLHAEQGLGDAIQFIRYVKQVKALGGKVVVWVQEPLGRLLSEVAGVDTIVTHRVAIPPYDVKAPLMSLPRILGTTLETIPQEVPYLRAERLLVEEWRARVATLLAGRKVGLVWQGRPKHKNDRQRSVALSRFGPLVKASSVSWVSLQMGEGQEQIGTSGLADRIVDWTADIQDFADTAALIANLDLVITVDTAVAHLAGAMGKPTWVLLPFVPDWRWLLEREDSPWYPTMRLFRQTKLGDWDGVFERVKVELEAEIGA